MNKKDKLNKQYRIFIFLTFFTDESIINKY